MDTMEWLWQGVLSDWFAAAGIALGVLILGYLKANYPKWASVVLYGLACLFLLTVSLWAFRSMAALPKEATPQVTVQNVETNIKAWLDHFRLDWRERTLQDSYFAYLVTLKDDSEISVHRSHR
jgi:hypothetical protein